MNRDQPAASDGREPFFRHVPVGVASLTGVILAVHGALMLAPQWVDNVAWGAGAIIPSRLEGGEFAYTSWVSAAFPFLAHQFLHAGLVHLFMNLALLVQVGPLAEQGLARRAAPALRFVLFFLCCGVAGALGYLAINPHSEGVMVGASGAISGVFAGYLWAAIGLAPAGRAVLKPVLVSGGVFLAVNVGLAAVARVTGVVPIAWESHLAGFVAGLALYPVFARLGPLRQAWTPVLPPDQH